MDLSNFTALTPKPGAPMPLISKTIKKNQTPICDVFGPFPDETVLSGIDRLLSLIGAQRIQRLLNLPPPSIDTLPSDASINIDLPPESPRSYSNIITESSNPASEMTSAKKCCCLKCSAQSAASVKLPEVKGSSDKPPLPLTLPPPPPRPQTIKSTSLERSFSLCSLACRKLKQVCFQSKSPNCMSCPNNDQGEGNIDIKQASAALGAVAAPKWIWTRMFCDPSGYEVFEIYKKSCTCMHPSQIKIKSSPKLIFVVLPNGLVMPFETVSCH